MAKVAIMKNFLPDIFVKSIDDNGFHFDMSIATTNFDWSRYTGPRGGQGWKNEKGDIIYGDKPVARPAKPTESQTATEEHGTGLEIHPNNKEWLRDVKDGAVEAVTSLGQEAWSKIPKSIQKPLAGAWGWLRKQEHKLDNVYFSQQKYARKVGLEAGLSEEQMDKVAGVLTKIDFAAANLGVNAIAAHHVLGIVGGPVAFLGAKMGRYVPIASVAFIVGIKALQTEETITDKKKRVELITKARAKIASILEKHGKR